MKITDKKKPINTIPKGVWESSRPEGKPDQKKSSTSTASADLQKNGYPSDKQGK